MTKQKHLKQLVRSRMEKTGERYAAARRNVLDAATAAPVPAKGTAAHLPGNVPATTALRVLLTAAGVRDPHSKLPFTEAMVFGLAGGIGIGVFSFYYEKADFASFFVGGRHLWHDDKSYLENAARRLAAGSVVKESSGAGPGMKNLAALVKEGTPCVAWVEMGLLPHRATKAEWLGGGYHVVTVYEIDERAGSAIIGDLADEPITVPLATLAAARARIKAQKHRVLALGDVKPLPEMNAIVRDGLRACHAGLQGEGAMARAKGNFRLDTLGALADRIAATSGKDAWTHVYAPGPRLWNGLTMLHDFVEHHGTGGGLCRPMFAAFLGDAGSRLRAPALRKLADRYGELGRWWTELAHAALPEDVPVLRESRELRARRAELLASGLDEAMLEEMDAVKARLDELGKAFAAKPLSDSAYARLRADLHDRVRALHERETSAHGALGDWLHQSGAD